MFVLGRILCYINNLLKHIGLSYVNITRHSWKFMLSENVTLCLR